MKRGKVIRTDGISLPDAQDMKDIGEAGYSYLGILETDERERERNEEKEMENKFYKEYLRWLRLILRSKLNGKKIMAVNTWAVYVMRYGADE